MSFSICLKHARMRTIFDIVSYGLLKYYDNDAEVDLLVFSIIIYIFLDIIVSNQCTHLSHEQTTYTLFVAS